eukprot:CAMPEP_0173153034 /NCGR_PEP_ID=MMETSP1105-20130129/12607_1 /TAXON_ID=2985 /ORGANISM="Ochromonas sp., Strain BG-1" /LENGTH=1169 /DNA_ID=CAMNT_0014068867 /DNA_START=356 /DNA_END=3865 /DNA_ORIENTATION=-
MKILVFGLRGVGVETCKNLSLQGAGSITLVDPAPVEPRDVGVNFFLTEKDIGQPRATIVAQRLKELNPICAVNVAESLDLSIVAQHSAVVITQYVNIEELLALNEFCRSRNISFFYSMLSGITSTIFVDHGPGHVVHDFDGERPLQKLITQITPIANSPSECLIRYDTPEGQQGIAITTGFFEISEVEGIERINGQIFAIKRVEGDPVKTIRVAFSLAPEEQYIAGGVLTEKKTATPHPMHSLAEKIKSPGDCFGEPPSLVSTDLLNFGSEVQIHLAWLATLKYANIHGNKLPRVHHSEDAKEVLDIAKHLLSKKEVDIGTDEINEDILLRYAKHAAIELQAMSAFAGGVLAQEVVKSTGKFTPIPGFMHFSAPETLPAANTLETADVAPRGLPQDELASLFGWEFVEKLGNLRYFMVGCGALGCELLKNFALNGICCGPQGKLTVTDADRIELSNLSRQFLFREHNVGQPKSKAAAAMVQVMNPKFNIESLEQFVGPNSEDVFNDDFWEVLSGVCNALDNMEARLYVDRQCVKYEKPLLESGTMGTKGNVDTVCPFKTRTYGEGVNAAESGGVPMCTLRNFPHITEHCIEWSRDQFEYLFVQIGKKLETYLADPVKFQAKLKEKASVEAGAALFDIRSLISFARFVFRPSIGTAAQLSFDIFHFLFRDKILDLQAAFPKDYRIIDEKTKADKGPFWNEKKRYPTVAVFNVNDSSHSDFLLSCTCLFSVMAGLIPPKREDDDDWLKDYRDQAWIQNIAAGLTPPSYIQAPVHTEDDKSIGSAQAVDKQQISQILDQLFADLQATTSSTSSSNSNSTPTPSPAPSSPSKREFNFNFEPISFEKDDDLNFHIDFVTSAANLRCDNYSLKRTDFQSCKVIAGRIIPAIATTTAAVCGLVTLELFKLVLDKDTDSYMNRAIGLGSYSYTSFTADAPIKFSTKTEVIQPDIAQGNLPSDAYDESGKIKLEYCEQVTRRVYPEGHSVWDKLVVSGSWTLGQFSQWLLETHKLKLLKWDFIYGYVNKHDEENNQKQLKGVSTSIFPPAVVLDYSLLPSLDLTLPQASGEIMRNKAAKPTQQYISLWKSCKEKGVIPPQPSAENLITESTTLRDILLRMSQLAESSAERKDIDLKAISKAEHRKFVVIPGSEAPMCSDVETGDTIENLCAIKIVLKE